MAKPNPKLVCVAFDYFHYFSVTCAFVITAHSSVFSNAGKQEFSNKSIYDIKMLEEFHKVPAEPNNWKEKKILISLGRLGLDSKSDLWT